MGLPLSLLYSVLVYLPVQRIACDAQQFGGLFHIAIGLFQGLAYCQSFYVFQIQSIVDVLWLCLLHALNLEDIERLAIRKALEQANGNMKQAAELLGITRYALYRKIDKHGI